MIYICIAARNNADTVGLLLWKIRQVFTDYPREFHLLVADDGSVDSTAEVLDPYQRALPLTVYRNDTAKGYAESLERLLVEALRRTDRPRRDFAVTLPANFAISPEWIPELVRRVESGADVVIGEIVDSEGPLGPRMLRRWAPHLLKPGLNVPGAKDLVSGFGAYRLITLKKCLNGSDRLLETDGITANAELVARAAAVARQIAAVEVDLRDGALSGGNEAWRHAVSLFLAGRRLTIPAPEAELKRAS